MQIGQCCERITALLHDRPQPKLSESASAAGLTTSPPEQRPLGAEGRNDVCCSPFAVSELSEDMDTTPIMVATENGPQSPVTPVVKTPTGGAAIMMSDFGTPYAVDEDLEHPFHFNE